MDNYKSATGYEIRNKIEQTLLGEIACGNYVITDVKPTTVSALGAVQKPESEEVRFVPNWSQLAGDAVHDYADIDRFNFRLSKMLLSSSSQAITWQRLIFAVLIGHYSP